MAKLDNRILQLYDSIGESLKFRIIKILSVENKVATGRLINSIDVVTGGKNGKYFIELLMERYGIYVNQGRKPGGKMPPEKAILNWMQVKGIPLNLLWPIRKSIAINGIPGVFFIEESIKRIENDFQKEISDKWGNEFAEEISNQLQNALKLTN